MFTWNCLEVSKRWDIKLEDVIGWILIVALIYALLKIARVL